jgi:hypothetical protein
MVGATISPNHERNSENNYETSVGGVSTNGDDDLELCDQKRSDRNHMNLTGSLSTNNQLSEQQIIPALGRLFSRPKQQFAILMGVENSNYRIDFPTDIVEYCDDEIWFESRLRDNENDTLMVVLGWTMQRMRQYDYNESNNIKNSWYIHSIDWQDFRDLYRPGIGREEWERICG